jgi:hypothetical protein
VAAILINFLTLVTEFARYRARAEQAWGWPAYWRAVLGVSVGRPRSDG